MQITFAQQGVGNLTNSMVICLLLLIFNETDCVQPTHANDSFIANNTCSPSRLEAIWRLQFGICVPIMICILLYRWVFLQESKIWLDSKKANSRGDGESNYTYDDVALDSDEPKSITDGTKPNGDSQVPLDSGTENVSLKSGVLSSVYLSVIYHYWHRLFGTASVWFLWDVAFYGNKLFQGSIITQILGAHSTIYHLMQYTILNSAVALVGYYAAAIVVDKPWMGRFRLQNLGLFLSGVLFLVGAVWFEFLSEHPLLFLFLYLINSFFGQFGPNCTTWLLPSELFPTEIRPQSHGISAAAGKFGALLATLIFAHNAGPSQTSLIFGASAACAFLGLLCSVIFIPDVTTLSLVETDKRWDSLKRGLLYDGPAVEPMYSSYFEIFLRFIRPKSDKML